MKWLGGHVQVRRSSFVAIGLWFLSLMLVCFGVSLWVTVPMSIAGTSFLSYGGYLDKNRHGS